MTKKCKNCGLTKECHYASEYENECEKFEAEEDTSVEKAKLELKYNPLKSQKGCGKKFGWVLVKGKRELLICNERQKCAFCEECSRTAMFGTDLKPAEKNHSSAKVKGDLGASLLPARQDKSSDVDSSNKDSIVKSSGDFDNLSEKIYSQNINIEYIKIFIKKNDKIIIEEINKTNGSFEFDLNNLYSRICRRINKLAGEELTRR